MVEVVVALAVMLLGIVAVLGLLPNALQSGRNAADNTLAATIVQDTFSQLRAYPFNAAKACNDPIGCPSHDLSTLTIVTPPDNAFFDVDGVEVGSLSADRYYHVTVSYTLESTPNLWSVTNTVVWPAKSAAPINTNIFVSKITRYDQ